MKRVTVYGLLTVAGICLLLVAAGCGRPSAPKTSQSDAQEVTEEDPSQSARSYIRSTLDDSQRPSSPDEFVAEFARRFDENPEDAFVELTYWGSASQEDRMAVLEEFVGAVYSLTEPRKRGTLNRAKLRFMTLQEYGSYAYTPDNVALADPDNMPEKIKILQHEPTYILELVVQHGPNVSMTDYIAFGEWNGRYYFCSTRTQ